MASAEAVASGESAVSSARGSAASALIAGIAGIAGTGHLAVGTTCCGDRGDGTAVGTGHLAATATYGDGDDVVVPGEEPFGFVNAPIANACYSLWRVRIVSARHLPKV